MILVIGEEHDISTDYFIEWCHYTNQKVIRINENESRNVVNTITINNTTDNISFQMGACRVCLKDIEGVWFRRGYVSHYSSYQSNNNGYNDSISQFLENESKTLTEFVLYVLKQKVVLSDPEKYNANKLIALSVAASVGLKIPQTYISTSIDEVEKEFEGHKIITKPIQDSLKIQLDNKEFYPSISELGFQSKDGWETFYYSKFQKKIEKKYELRVFFLEDKFYAGATFPKNDINTKLFENESQTPRTIPYLLPTEIVDKLKRFNQLLKFDSGSFDIIVDKSGEYVFLEINPVGQFDYLSKLCNYYLDEEILNHFKKKISDERKTR